MLRELVTLRINQVLHQLRVPIAAIALLFILYCNIYMWFYVPHDDYEFTWSPDTQLRILSVPEESLARPYLQPDDVLIALEGRPVRRMGVLYPLPLRTTYHYTVQRGGEVLTYAIPIPAGLTSLAVKNQLPTTLLSLTGWIVGALLLFFARRDNTQAVHAGYIFLLAPVVLVGIQAGQDGTPFAWLGGQALVFFLATAWPYLGLIPRQQPLGAKINQIFRLLLIVGAGCSLLAIYEILFLYPRSLSFEYLYGISMYSLGFSLAAVGLIFFVLLLGWRAFTLSNSPYLQQQLLILLVFVAIGVFPIVFLTILPSVLLQTIFLPFPIAIGLMSFIPAGYLFVIYRRGFLGLDPFFSRTIYLALLSLLAFGFYTGGLYVVQRILNLGGPEAVLPATVVFFPTLLLSIYINQPVNSFVQQLVYGKVALNQEVLAQYAVDLSARPEIDTLDRILSSLADMLGSSCATLILRDREGQLMQVSAKGIQGIGIVDGEFMPQFDEPIVRAAVAHHEMPQVLVFFQWAELAVPLKAREEQIGILAFSQPDVDGYFNAKQVAYLVQTASMLAVASENITLFETARHLSMRAQVVQERERQRLALEIHDAPLQEITFVTNTIDHLLFSLENDATVSADQPMEKILATLSRTNAHLRAAAMTLRQICMGLYPPFRDQGVNVMVQALTEGFQEKHGLHVNLEIDNSLQPANIEGADAMVMAVSHVLVEALTNVAKHASDATVCVRLSVDEDNLYLSVIDNGPGVPICSPSELLRQRHFGIVGMHQWAKYAGGQLQLRNVTPHGLEVFLTCPMFARYSMQQL